MPAERASRSSFAAVQAASCGAKRSACANVIFHRAELDHRAQAEQAVQQVRVRGVGPWPEPLLRAAIAVLTP